MRGRRDLYFTVDFRQEPVAGHRFLFVPQMWTVALELMFYSLAPLLVRRRVLVLGAGILASLGLRVWLMTTYGLKDDPWTYRLFPTELALFLSGAIAWHLHRALQRAGWLRPALCWSVLAGTLALVVGYQALPRSIYFLRPFGLPLVLALVPLVLPFVFEATRRHRLDRALGELSYPTYLVHYLLIFVVEAIGGAWLAANQGFVVLVGTLLCAWLLWHFVGRPLEAGRQRIGASLVGVPSVARGA